MYKVKKSFFDLQDGDRWYTQGEEYPRKGYKPTEARLAELLSDRNGQHEPLIEEVKEPKKVEKAVEEPAEEAPKKTAKKKEAKKK